MSGEVDFGRAAKDYARHRQGFPESFFTRLRERFGVGVAGQRVLDVGTGTGQLARGLASGGARVTGLDRSRELLEAGEPLDREAGVEVARVCAPAEATGLADASFDVVAAAQCFHWFDLARAGAEFVRLLVPGGRVVVAQLDWLPRPASVPELSEELILRVNPTWTLGGGDGLPTHFVGALEEAGFTELETFSYDVDLEYTQAAWRGRIRASAGVAAGPLTAGEVDRFDEEHARLLAERFRDPLRVPHRVFCVVGVRP